MTWKLTQFAKERFGHTELEELLFDKAHDWLPDGGRFVLQGMGMGHFYLEDYSKENCGGPIATIFFNEEHVMYMNDPIVARWV